MLPKRTVSEWLTIARIAKDVKHLFVEGASDARVLAHAFGYPLNIDFRTADEIEFEIPHSHPLWGGNKLRLMELAFSIDSSKTANMRSFVDSDFAPLVSYFVRSNSVIQSKSANLPSSTLSFNWMQGFLIKGYGCLLDNKKWEFLCYALKFCFVCRFLAAVQVRPRAVPCASDFVSLKKRELVFDALGYTGKTFDLKGADRLRRLSLIEEFLYFLQFDIKYLANSNDIFDILYSLLRTLGHISGSVPRDAVRQAYLAALDDAIFRGSDYAHLGEWLCEAVE